MLGVSYHMMFYVDACTLVYFQFHQWYMVGRSVGRHYIIVVHISSVWIQLSASSVPALISSFSKPTHTHTQAMPATKSLLIGFNIKKKNDMNSANKLFCDHIGSMPIRQQSPGIQSLKYHVGDVIHPVL